ncbi:MAG: TAXI family TRAP transporter solute-binding subunit, partial [Bacillota bacterium]
MAFGQNGVCYCAYYGTMQYAGKPQTFIRGMTYLYPNVMHFMARKGAGVKSVADLKGKKFVPGAVASATEINGREILKIYGLNYMKDKGEVNVRADFVGYNEAADLIKNNQTDAVLIAGGLPTAAVMDMFASAQVELVNLEKAKI